MGVGADLQGGGGSYAAGRSGDGYSAGVTADSTVGTLDPEALDPEALDPEAAAWFTAEVAALRAALSAAPDSAGLVRALYATQQIDRADALGEHAQTMTLLAGIRAPLVGGDTLTAREREAGEAALVAGVHDALRAGRYDEAEALLAPFVSEASPLPEIAGARARTTLALALVALDEAAGDLASALARLGAVQAALGPEEESSARDLAATAVLLEGRLDEEATAEAGREAGASAPAAALSALDVPLAYALLAPYPNPTTGRTTVPFALPAAARVELAVYDVLGRRVATLADGPFGAGRHAVVLDGSRLASGVYVVRAEADRWAASRVVTLTR